MVIDKNTCLLLANGCTITIGEIAAIICAECTPGTCSDVVTINDCNGAVLGSINPGDTVTIQDCNGVVLGTINPGDTVTIQDCNSVSVGSFCV